MYRHCIYCSGDLGRNESIEAFPVGRSIAFDAGRGRLWAVCPQCSRWNLSPLEERWEAVEEAEKRFADSRLRAQSENVGLARLPDGTRLIRVGRALPGELAAWRYGGQLVDRRRRHWRATSAAALMAGGAIVGGAAVTGLGLLATWFLYSVFVDGPRKQRRDDQVIYVARPYGEWEEAFPVRRGHVAEAHLARGDDGGLQLWIPRGRELRPRSMLRPDLDEGGLLVLYGADARAALGRALVQVNEAGATRRQVKRATRILEEAPSTEAFIGYLAWMRARLSLASSGDVAVLSDDSRLALEMALHEESERRAMEGELALLEAAWRQAEEIAAIADRLASGLGSTESIAPAGPAPERPVA